MKTSNIKNFVLPFSVCLLVSIGLYPKPQLKLEDYSTKGLVLDFTINDLSADFKTDITNTVFSLHLGKSFQGFKEAIGFKESRGDYFAVNTLGYLGKYQFGKSTLKMLGIHDTQRFLNSPKLQEKAFIANTQRNKWILRHDIERFTGKTFSGVTITESGILAAAHLAGAGSVKKYLRSYGNKNSSDAYGATVAYYMKKFADYNTSIITPIKRAKALI